jgi:hypothetical protein
MPGLINRLKDASCKVTIAWKAIVNEVEKESSIIQSSNV